MVAFKERSQLTRKPHVLNACLIRVYSRAFAVRVVFQNRTGTADFADRRRLSDRPLRALSARTMLEASTSAENAPFLIPKICVICGCLQGTKPVHSKPHVHNACLIRVYSRAFAVRVVFQDRTGTADFADRRRLCERPRRTTSACTRLGARARPGSAPFFNPLNLRNLWLPSRNEASQREAPRSHCMPRSRSFAARVVL